MEYTLTVALLEALAGVSRTLAQDAAKEHAKNAREEREHTKDGREEREEGRPR
jgi:hypothetical protein